MMSVTFIQSDLEFILQQTLIAESHAAGTDLTTLIPNTELAFGLRTVDGSDNNLIQGRTEWGAADNTFPRMTTAVFRPAEAGTSYLQTSGQVVDSQPRTISNLIVDQTANNPAALAAANANPGSQVVNGTRTDGTPFQTLFIPNIMPDAGLTVPFNSYMTFFGQFFDHGLDLVSKGGNGTVFMPLNPDDPLFVPGSPTNFMVLTRATMLPGLDGVLGTADDIHENINTTSPFVDQNQTYSSHPSHQVFLRAYELNAAGDPVTTGKLIVNRNLGADERFGTLDDVVIGGMATWAVVKAQARDLLGIQLTDADVFNVPLLATDPYGTFLRGPNGFPQLVTTTGLVEGNPAANGGAGLPLPANVIRTGHGFLDDIAHTAVPNAGLTADADTVAGNVPGAGTYDNELLDAHYIAGDGRVNENIGLTTVHHVFHSEHNRLVDHVKDVVLQSGDVAFLNQWLLTPVAAIPADPSALVWNGERLFQAAKFGTEMQYQHLVFEEFARTIQPQINVFIDFDDTINPSITAEFAHTVYRFGHSMLTETIDRLDPNFASSEIGLIQAFLNPLAFAASGPTPDEAAGAIVRGVTRQVGNEIDEFVTEALRNNLVGLPLDLPAINLARGRDAGIPSLNAARRTFFAGTGDNQLKPYTSWFDFSQSLKHPESLVNFIAAYGTHTSITSVTTLAGKRAAATLLVLGGPGEPADRLDFLNSTGVWASGPGGVTTTGLDDVDFWVGGLAEKKMPFGGFLGSTFNFVFETQLEALQDGDRLYYLHRTAGINFLKELENNSFAKLVMANTDATHLPALVFLTPAFTLEVDPSKQFNASVANDPGPDGILFDDPLTLVDESADNIATPTQDPLGPNPIPLVIRDNPATPGTDTNYLHYTGAETIVLGGTTGADILIAGASDDDTVYGDGGNDRLEGGFGNDDINGGDGDDIITDVGGDDVIHGEAGNDVIHAGNGLNLIIAGPGSDFIVTGEDVSDIFAGTGNDFILGARLNAFPNGNEGDDWLELGLQDGAAGDNFDPFGQDLVVGHDVFLGDGGFDEALGEGGDDIIVGSEGNDKYDGNSGFDWVTYKDDRFGVTVDFFKNAANAPAVPVASFGATVAFVEGLSGSAFADVLRGDDLDAAQIRVAGFTGSMLINLDLITGLRAFIGAAAAGPDGLLGTPDDQFGAGNIILGGDGSDILEGRAGDDLIDGDRWLNVRISVRENADGTGAEIRSANTMAELVPDMVSGAINPGQLVIVREILTAPGGFDTAVFSGNLADYTVTTVAGVTTVTHNAVLPGVGGGVVSDGTDRLTNIERLQFNDQTVVLASGLNNAPVGAPTVNDPTPAVGQVLTASVAGVTDADNPGGTITGPVSFYWQFERLPGSGVFEDITPLLAPRAVPNAVGSTFTVTPNLLGSALRVKAQYQDANGVLETVFSTATVAVAAGTPAPGPAPLLNGPQTGIVSPGVHFLGSDLQFILDQIKLSERHAAGEDLLTLVPSPRQAIGLRTVDGSLNNLLPGQTEFGAGDNTFPRLLDPVFRDAQTFDPDGPGPAPATPTSYNQTSGIVVDSQPRTISNLIVDQTANNPAAIAAAEANPGAGLVIGTRTDGTPFETFFLPNIMPDAGLTVPFNTWMTFFGQFFDHGLDLVNKGGNGTVFMPLKPDDPLFDPGPDNTPNTADDGPNFMVVTRATMLPGDDGLLGTTDDIHENTNQDSPFVDQNQTYSAHPSHQVFLRAYEFNAAGQPVTTGKLIVNRILGDDGEFGTLDDVVIGGMATWAVVKAQARDLLGINLTDADVFNVPLLATDPYGSFLPGLNGFPQIVTDTGFVQGDPAANGGNGINIPANVVRTGHAFLDDIAHTAAPTAGLDPDADTVAGGPVDVGFYDNELLDAHFIAGDGRVNENIGLTTVHHIFHSEHNRLVDHVKAVVLDTAEGGNVAFLNEWLLTPVAAVPADPSTLVWNGERLFQAAKFGTEMQYQHLVFEEFARTIQPQIDLFIPGGQNYQTEINPAIMAEFAHTVYRFGHSMLTETIDRLNPNFASTEIGLIQAFLNPLAFTASGPSPDEAAGAIVRGVTRQVGNGIDEFVTEALRNNLVGLPLDLPAINMARARDTGVPSLNAARREFYALTADSQLKPYTSWTDFAMHLKHPESLINFIAAYGTHDSITSATTLADKRATATLLVLGGVGAPADRLDFLNSTGILWASGPGGVTTTGLDDVDFWIGGLAEQIMPFGGMLGSTFNFVFELQLEKLQNADRFYYLERTANLNFITELENNSFAKLIMANTDATHLPGLVFLTPAFTLEVDPTKQFNPSVVPGPDGILVDDPLTLINEAADNLPATADPVGDSALIPLVIRDNPATPGPDTNYLQYTGGETIVLGGTAGNDILIAGASDDDTVWGDAGNDYLEGGFGNDNLRGGAGDDIITDIGGDDVIHGDDGNDVIQGGNGLNLVLGGFGNDFIVTGQDASEAFGGPGNDFILGSNANEQDMGNEGDDWIEQGNLDGSPGDNFDPLGRDLVIGNDVYIGSGGPDIMNAEGGDDIMVGSAGPGDKYLGASGFDWATFKDDLFGANVDLSLKALVLVDPGIAARFGEVEGLSGSRFSDILRGDNADAALIATAGAQGSVLTNFDLISGLRAFVGAAGFGPDGLGNTADDRFGAGNIILGGDGSDLIEGDSSLRRNGGGLGGNDLIDGDKWLNVRISVRANADGTGAEIASFDNMVPLVPLMLNGTYTAGQLVIVREILPGSSGFNFDTARFSGNRANYTVGVNNNGTPLDPTDDIVTVTDLVGVDGSDRLTRIERLRFADQSVVLVPGLNAEPVGFLTIDSNPFVGEVLTVSAAGVSDADGLGPISYVWQFEPIPGTGVFQDIQIDTGVAVVPATGLSVTVTPNLLGLVLRVQGVYQDGHGVLETVVSAPTNPVTLTDVGQPSVTINQAAGQADPANTSPINFTAVFVEPVTGFTGADVSFAGSTAPGSLTATVTGSGTTYNVAVSGMTSGGTVIASIAAGVAQDAAGNLNTASTSTDNSVLYTVPPVLDLHAFDAGNFLDNFNTPSFSNSNGTTAWTTSWTETGDSGGVTAGQIQIDAGGGGGTNQLRFLGGAGANFNGASIQRVVDLTGATSATLSFTYAEIGFDAGETVLMQFAEDGANFTTVQTINSASGTGTSNIALTGPFGANSTIRFVVSGVNSAAESVRIDNVNIAYTTPGNDASNDYATTYTEDGAAVAIASGPGITDPDSPTLQSAKIVLTNAKADDALSISGALPSGISSSIDLSVPGEITMNLTGGATPAAYETAIAAVRFANGSQSPDTTLRSINVTVNDGAADSNIATATVTVVAVDDLTIAGNDRLLINAQNTDVVIPEWALLANDLDLDTILDITAVSNPVGLGTLSLTINADSITLSDVGAANGSFSYTAGSATANVAVVLDAGPMSGNNTGEVIIGSAGVNTISGNGGNDIILARDGNDTIVGGAGNDRVYGELGNDTFTYAMGAGADAVDGGAHATADILSITGGGAADILDVIYNGTSLTNFEGGTIVDVEVVNASLGGGTDTLSYAGSTAAVAVNLGTSTASGFTTITAIENVTGGSGADSLTGSTAANALNGGDGGDILIGGDGNDTINTGAANDDVSDIVRWGATAEFGDGDTVNNFDATGTAAQIDRVEFIGAAVLALFDNGLPDGIITWVTGDNVNNNNIAVNLNGAIEALFLDGANGEGVTNANLTGATAVAAEFNAEFNLTAANGEATLLVINDTNANSASIWRWLQAGGGEIAAGELIRIGNINANGTVTTDSLGFAGAPLLAAAARVPAGTSGGGLDQAALQPVAQAAIANWTSLGLSADVASRLQSVRFVITNLPSSYLGMAVGNTIFLDADAAGNGWFVDRTPTRNEEFLSTGLGGELRAIDPLAVDRIDLMTVVSHELGHIAGLDDLDASLGSLMSGKLSAGVRRTVWSAGVDTVLESTDRWWSAPGHS